MHESIVAEHVSHLGLDDAFSAPLAKALANTHHPAKALRQCQWTIPPHAELQAMPPHERVVVLMPIVSIVVAKLTVQLSLNRSTQAELVAEGCDTLSRLDFTFARDIKNYAWTVIYRNISDRLDDLKRPQVMWGGGDSDTKSFNNYLSGGVAYEGNCDSPLNGEYLDDVISRGDKPGIFSRKQYDPPFTDWAGIFPALRSLFDVCQDDTDRAIIRARWADGRCIQHGYIEPIAAIADVLGIEPAEVLERLHCLCNRWRCYINRTQRFTKHLPALPPRDHISCG